MRSPAQALTVPFFGHVARRGIPRPGARPGRGAGARREVRLDSPAVVLMEIRGWHRNAGHGRFSSVVATPRLR